MLAIIHARVHTITRGVLDDAGVLVEDGRITEVGRFKPPARARVIDAQGRSLFPGFIDAHTHLGVHQLGVGWEGSDVNELTSPATPDLRAIDAVNPDDEGFRDALASGITAAWVTPGSGNVIGGRGVVLRTAGRTADEMAMLEPAGLKIAVGENPKRVYSGRKQAPSTRLGIAAMLREWFARAQEYRRKLEAARAGGERPPERDLKLDAIVPVLTGAQPLRAHAHRADDILTVLRIAREFGMPRVVIEHCTDGERVASDLAAAGAMAVVGPTMSARSKVELRHKTLRTPAALHRAGVPFALTTDHPVVPIQFLCATAGLAVREGLPEEEALKAITINPARLLGVHDRIGSIELGKEADLVIWDGHPFNLSSRPTHTIVGGEIVYAREG